MFDEYKNQLDRIEKKIDDLHEMIATLTPEKKKKNTSPIQTDDEQKNEIQHLYAYYKVKVNNQSRLIEKAIQKIKSRLKEYPVEDLKKAIEQFSKDDWWMKNNAHRGVAWFFHSEERIEQFLNLTEQNQTIKLELYHNEQPCKLFDQHLKIYTPWSGQWLDWNKSHPQFEKFMLKKNGKKVAEGKEAWIMFIKHYDIKV